MRRKLKWISVGLVLALVLFSGSHYYADVPVEDLLEQYTNAESEWLEVAGARVHFRDEGEGPPLLLVHGTSASLHTWDGWTQALRDDFRVVRMDLPAFGLTGPSASGDYTIGGYVAFVDAFAAALGIERFALAGNSLGGLIAWRYALAHPQRVARLILVDPGGRPHEGLSVLLMFGQVPGLNLIMQYITPRLIVRQQIENVYGDPSRIAPGVVDRYHKLLLRSGNRAAFVRYTNIADFSEHFDRINEITTPTLIMWGDQDRLIPVEFADDFAAALPQAQVQIYPGVGHIPMEEIPERSAADARVFLGDY